MRIEISGDTATVYADTIRRPQVAARLIDAAGPGRAGVVRTVTGGNSVAFAVPVDVARAAGLLPDHTTGHVTAESKPGAEGGQQVSEPEPTTTAKPEPKTPAKPRTRKAESSDAD